MLPTVQLQNTQLLFSLRVLFQMFQCAREADSLIKISNQIRRYSLGTHRRDCNPISVTRLGDFWTLGNFLKPLATINLPKSPTFLGIFCKGVKISHFSSEIIFG